ncbi:MAG TPA: ammonia channel protein, partial [Casimicrobiaceae bacterium]|nr:ammonia channel protein [Casimicrobiaceae bacterium]
MKRLFALIAVIGALCAGGAVLAQDNKAATTPPAATAPAAAPAAADSKAEPAKADASAPAAAAAPAAAPPAPTTPQVIGVDKISSGDTAWMLTSTALVLLMTIPGLALFYGGMVRRKNVLSTLMQSFILVAIVSI